MDFSQGKLDSTAMAKILISVKGKRPMEGKDEGQLQHMPLQFFSGFEAEKAANLEIISQHENLLTLTHCILNLIQVKQHIKLPSGSQCLTDSSFFEMASNYALDL